jgi:[ribosomal protein S5]-alanine N-acetyltransferase
MTTLDVQAELRPELIDGTVRLRAWRTADAAWYAATAHDPLIQRFTTEPPDLTPERAAEIIRTLAATSECVAYVICPPVAGEPCGAITVRLDDGVGEVSYWVAPEARGRGIATAALRLLSDWLLARGDVRELRLWTHVADTAALRVARNAGYRRDPDRDATRTVKGQPWPTVACRLIG